MKTNKTTKKIDTAAIVKAAEARKKDAEKSKVTALKEKALAEKAKEVAEREKAKAEKSKRGEMLILAAEEGRAATGLVTTDHYLNGLQRAIGKDYVVTDMSLALAKGAEPTERSLIKLISGLAGATEGLDRAKGSTTFALGDACLITKQAFPDRADEIISQAANTAGREKHTIIQAMRVAEFFPSEERTPGLTFTHFQELMNYSREKGTGKLKITKAQQRKLLEEAFVVEGLPITKADGEKVAARKEAISVREFRERLQEKVGKTVKQDKAPAKKAKAPVEVDPDKHEFLYVFDSDSVQYSIGLNLELCKSGDCLVIDITDKTVLNDKGAIHFQIQQLDLALPDTEPTPAPVEETPKAEKPKKEKAKKAEQPKQEKKSKDEIPD